MKIYKVMSFLVDKPIAQSRYEICKQCDNFNKTFKICSICVCFMPAKVTLRRAHCPEKKWSEHVSSNKIVESYSISDDQEISVKILKNVTIVSKNKPSTRRDGSPLRSGDLWIKDSDSIEVPELYRFTNDNWTKAVDD